MTQTNRTSAADVRETVLGLCAPGRSRAVLIEGAPGLGKSDLLGRVARQAAATGSQVLTATGTGRPEPFGILRQLAFSSPELAASALLDGDAHRPAATAAAFCAALRRLAGSGPVVLCVDDIQHADPQSLEPLRYVVRYAHPAPVIVAVTTGTYGDRWAELFTGNVLRGPHVHRVRLPLLGPDDTERALAAEGMPDGPPRARAAARLHRLSGGNPRLLHALLAEDAALRQPAPGGPFARAVADCLRRGGPAALTTAHALAVLGEHPVDPTLLAALVDGGASKALDGLAALRACGLLDGLGRRDPAVRAATLASCTAPGRTRLRWRAAHTLHTNGAPAVAVAAPLLALPADGARPPARTGDRHLLTHTARDLAEAGRALRERGRRADADALLRAARRLSAYAGDLHTPRVTGRAEPADRLTGVPA
ncbi:AAA family ATPase [Streptomyces sp. NPDC102406]|uniref:AAA family ATPase n=1 Tax=Streptomyces sp. NPDC102406 TaxID=3366171 RepID=UPI00382E8261